MEKLMLKLRAAAAVALSAFALSACTDKDAEVQEGPANAALYTPAAPGAALVVGLTFKADGQVRPAVSDALYQSLSSALGRRGGWDVHRLGRGSDDFAPVIAAVAAAPGAARADTAPRRLLVLVESRTDRAASTRLFDLPSGIPYGAFAVDHAAERADITVAYRDSGGPQRVCRVRQDLLFSGHTALAGQAGAGSGGQGSLRAFDRIVGSSFDGLRNSALASGRPRLELAQRAP